jgi:tungstate transport system ATP-binding protein
MQSLVSARDLSVVFGEQKTLDIPALDVAQGEALVVIGPNGSGKTTLLRCLALLTKPTTGILKYAGEPVTTPKQALDLRRRLAVVFQEPLLLNTGVWENVILGLRMRRVPKPAARARAEKWLGMFGVGHLLKRQAKTLSGGEAKRVSLARAFALEPEVLYLDEPFAALDSPTRASLLADFEGILRETRVTTVMVTHDRNEALMLADQVAVLIAGRIRQMGKPEEVFNYPVDEEVAGFVEAGNILKGSITRQDGGLAAVRIEAGEIEVVTNLSVDTRITACLPHEDVTLTLQDAAWPQSSARNRLPGKVTRMLPMGSQMRVAIDCGFPLVALITRRSWEGMGLREGQKVVATFKASSIHLIPHK